MAEDSSDTKQVLDLSILNRPGTDPNEKDIVNFIALDNMYDIEKYLGKTILLYICDVCSWPNLSRKSIYRLIRKSSVNMDTTDFIDLVEIGTSIILENGRIKVLINGVLTGEGQLIYVDENQEWWIRNYQLDVAFCEDEESIKEFKSIYVK